MLWYYNNFNICTTDDFFHWQRNAIDWAIRKIIKKQSQSLIKINENVRKKVREIKQTHEKTLISLDINCSIFQISLNIIMLIYCQKPDKINTIKRFLEI